MKADRRPVARADRPQHQARVSRRLQRRTDADAEQRRARLARWGSAIILVPIVLAVGWLGYRQYFVTSAVPGELPAPRGGPSQAQDVNTLVGTLAPAFTLADADGQSYTVTPGQERPLVLISHMGIT